MGKRKKRTNKSGSGNRKLHETGGKGNDPTHNSLPTKLQLSLLNSRLVVLAEQQRAVAAIPKKPVETATFTKFVDQRRKYPALLRVEWQVRK